MPVSKKEVGECPVDAMMRVMDGRWKGTILWRLQDRPRRTSELKRSIPGITERMLIRHLQELVADGIVKRDDKKTIPPCVYYSLWRSVISRRVVLFILGQAGLPPAVDRSLLGVYRYSPDRRADNFRVVRHPIRTAKVFYSS